MLPPGFETLVEDAPLTTAKAAIGIDIPTAVLSLATSVLSSSSSLPSPTGEVASAAQGGGGGMGGAQDEESSGECELLGPFALWVQLALGGLALLALVYKRWKERPQRPVKVWFFDVSKQVVGSMLVHVVNVFMSILTSGKLTIKVAPPSTATVAAAGKMLMLARRVVSRDGDDGGAGPYVPNPCSFYLLNLAIDTTLGIPILIVLLRVTTGLVALTKLGQPAESIQSGNYGEPPQWRWWGKQSFIYFCGLFGMKVCVLVLFLALPWISRVGDWALGWTEGNEKLQIFFVMMLFPLIMNAMQYYIIDSFIKKNEGLTSSDGGGRGGAEGGGHERLPAHDPEDDDESEVGAYDNGAFRISTESALGERDSRLDKPARNSRDEYDPTKDGYASTVVGSNASGRSQPAAKPLPTELLPKE